MSITTKTGDEGMTSLFYGTRVPKTDLRVQSCGTVDELSAAMGVARSLMSDACKEKNILLESQKDLILLMGEIMIMPGEWERHLSRPHKLITSEHITRLEEHIRQLEQLQKPGSWNWSVPGEDRVTAALHLARTVCRRAERSLWAVLEADQEALSKNETARKNISLLTVYLNRLSDLLWLIAQVVHD